MISSGLDRLNKPLQVGCLVKVLGISFEAHKCQEDEETSKLNIDISFVIISYFHTGFCTN